MKKPWLFRVYIEDNYAAQLYGDYKTTVRIPIKQPV